MILKIIAIVLGIMMGLGISIFLYEIKHAPIVDEKEPFLWDDYDEKKDKTLK